MVKLLLEIEFGKHIRSPSPQGEGESSADSGESIALSSIKNFFTLPLDMVSCEH